VVDFLKKMNTLTEISLRNLLGWCELCPRKFARWQSRYGKANEHNALVPRDHWLEEWEKQAIIDYARQHPLEGYRNLSFMMLDANVAAVAPSTTYRVLKNAGLMSPFKGKPTKKGTGFVQPLNPHEHWHIDFSYLNIGGIHRAVAGQPCDDQPLLPTIKRQTRTFPSNTQRSGHPSAHAT